MEGLLQHRSRQLTELREIAGTQDLDDVQSIGLTVEADSDLRFVGELLPNLVQLSISRSRVQTLRDLGSTFARIQVLWITHSGLQAIEGIGSLPCIRELYASYNKICCLEPLIGCDALEILDLEGNCIADMSDLALLACCPALVVLSVADNPVSELHNFRHQAARAIPHLCTLDDQPVNGREELKAAVRQCLPHHDLLRFIHKGPEAKQHQSLLPAPVKNATAHLLR
ncbi:hypothetical protein WJX74_002229 [Apatococcus lobatus]|uniref:Uncharacterized protein n=1 Tax=Apatococcus lobatus TaxID=904363 RepID=A0AAW1RH39_9CHLO